MKENFKIVPKDMLESLKEEFDLKEICDIDELGCSGASIFLFEHCVLKIEEASIEADTEYDMLQWLKGKLPVPMILNFKKVQGKNYLLMERCKGIMGIDTSFSNHPASLIDLLIDALNRLWQIDIHDCPIKQDLNKRLKLAKDRILNNRISMDDLEEETMARFDNSVENLYQYLVENKPKENFVFSHGDFCLPNIFFNNGKLEAFIDLGRSGICDYYQDIALLYRSIKKNFGWKVAKEFLNALPLEIDEEKIDYYILLDELF